MKSHFLPAGKLPVPILSALLGAIILLFGRRLFWLFVAAVGFAFGLEIAPHLMTHPPAWLALTVGILLGIIGAVVALILQKIAIAVVGFLVGGRVAVTVVAAFVAQHAHYYGLSFIIGGILGAILFLVLFDWALIVFSSLAGAHLIVDVIQLPASGSNILFIALLILGIVVQASLGKGKRA
jgi:Domain of unknown function (DUF4203)